MTGFLLDLWHDLREKRLAPVAVLLLVALIAVPVVMLKPASSSEGDPGAPAVAAGSTSQPTIVDAAQEGAGEGSDLGVFDPRNPFRPPPGMRAGPNANGDPITAIEPESPLGGVSTGAGPDPGSIGGGGGGGGGVTAPEPAPVPDPVGPVEPVEPGEPVRRSFTYVADVRFGRTGEERRRTVQRLELLPSAKNPVVVFLGVSATRKRAVFLLDTRFSQAGEGICRPSAATCSYIYLSPKKGESEHYFTDADGNAYRLDLLRIRRVEVGGRASAKGSGTGRGSPQARANAVGRRPLPVFVDEERVN